MWATRQATIEDLPTLHACASEFYSKSKHLKSFNIDWFVATWTGLLAGGTGVIFIAGDPPVGVIGGVAYPDINSGKPVASEFFWFVQENARGPGIALYRAFEQWARERGCEEIRMVHLSDSMPDRVRDFYLRMGYQQVETMYAKELQ